MHVKLAHGSSKATHVFSIVNGKRQMICQTCGHKNTDTADSCAICSISLSENVKTDTNEIPKSIVRKIVLIIIWPFRIILRFIWKITKSYFGEFTNLKNNDGSIGGPDGPHGGD